MLCLGAGTGLPDDPDNATGYTLRRARIIIVLHSRCIQKTANSLFIRLWHLLDGLPHLFRCACPQRHHYSFEDPCFVFSLDRALQNVHYNLQVKEFKLILIVVIRGVWLCRVIVFILCISNVSVAAFVLLVSEAECVILHYRLSLGLLLAASCGVFLGH